MKNTFRRWMLACTAIFVLASCETVTDVTSIDLFEEAPNIVCPSVEVIEQMSAYTVFDPAHFGDVNKAQYTVRFVGHSGECELDKDGLLKLNQYAFFLAQPGIAIQDSVKTDAKWFVAIFQKAGDKQEVLAREIFDFQVTLRKDSDPVPLREQFTITIPTQNPESLRKTSIVSGFLLDDADWDFNESHPFYFR